MLTGGLLIAIAAVIVMLGICAIAAAIGAGRADSSHERHGLHPL